MKRLQAIICLLLLVLLTACADKPQKNESDEVSNIMEESTSSENVTKPFVPENPDKMPIDDQADTSKEVTEAEETNYQNTDWYQEAVENAAFNLGNNKRLKAIIEKAMDGEDITIASIGGSVTEGAGATKYTECYAYQTYESFKTEYGNKDEDGANIHFINAGVGGTPSTFGIMRYKRDIVDRVEDEDGLPDIVLVEYSVNDGGEPTKHASYESLIKEILQQPNDPVVIIVFAVFPSGYTLQNEMVPVGKKYDLMMVSTKNGIMNGALPLVGYRWTEEEFFYDIYHPTTLGHRVMADFIMGAIKAAVEKETDESDIDLNVDAVYGTEYVGLKTIFKDSYDENIKLSVGGFNENDPNVYENIPIGKVYEDNFFHDATSGNKALTFQVNCKNLLLAFRTVNDESYGSIEVYVDGELVKTINANTGSWGQSVVELIFSEETATKHKIKINMLKGDEEKKFTITCMGYTE